MSKAPVMPIMQPGDPVLPYKSSEMTNQTSTGMIKTIVYLSIS